jgi:hypothetical protein
MAILILMVLGHRITESGKQIYLDKTGKEWPHIGWWGKNH